MSKKSKMSVEEVLAMLDVKPTDSGKKLAAKFSKEKFNLLMTAMFNDPDFTTKKAVMKGGDLAEVADIAVTKGFRKFCKHLLEKFGVDSAESERVMGADFTIDNTDGLYDFFATAIYEYIKTGNKFDLIPKEDFRGSIMLKHKPKVSKTVEVFQPKTRESLGIFTIEKEDYDTLAVKSPCPKNKKKKTKKNK